MRNDVPRQLGNYRLMSLLGQGGFATVYLGKHVHLGSLAAVKVLHPRFDSPDLVSQFHQEATIIARLVHPNIVRVLDFDVQEEDIAFLVMDYAPYGSLRRLYPGRAVPLSEIMYYVRQAASALSYAHQHRVIHRDVKPENMLIGADGKLLLSDFGLALLSSSRMSTQKDAAGTVAYMAPEQIQGKPRLASDQYALAVTVYEWLSGRRPFTGTVAEVTAKHLSANPPPLNISPAIEEVVMKALSKDPRERFANVLEFAKSLEAAAGVPPRSPSLERFTVPLEEADAGTILVSRASRVSRSRSNRDLASVKTIRQAQEKQQTTYSGPKRFHVSRRSLLLGIVGVVTTGSVGFAVAAAQRQPPSTIVQVSAPTSTTIASTPTPAPNPVATKSKATPRPDPTTPPAPDPTTQPPTQPPPPAPTPTPRPLIPSGRLYTVYRGHASVVFAVAWSPDGQHIASGGGDKTAQVWNATDGGRILSLLHTAAVTSVAWHPDGKRIASGCDDKTIHVWDAMTGNTIYTCLHDSSVHSVTWSPDGKYLASGSTDRTVRVWDAVDGALRMVYREHTGTVWGVAWSPDGKNIASCSADTTVKVWNIATGMTITTYRSSATIGNIAWSPDGKLIASAGDNTAVDIWNARTGQLISSYPGHNGIAYGVAWSPDGQSIASAGQDTTVAIINLQGSARYVYRGHSSYVFGVSWSPDGKRIASGSDDKTVQVWF